MKYQFPNIQNLSQVKNVIENVDGFIIAERDWGYVANYVHANNQTFPEVISVEDSIRRECRGLIFSKDGILISRPYHKFFNVGERTETLLENIDLSQSHVILEKLDGSMIRPIPIGGSFRLGTKMGITDVAMQAETWLADHLNYENFINSCISFNVTPIFEWCSRKQRIVIDYPVDRLVLTAIRHNNTGEYASLYELKKTAAVYNLDVVREYEGNIQNMESLMAETRGLQGQEGWIIRFHDGHMLKIKAEEYVIIHKAKDNILREKNVIEMILDEKTDDVKPFLLEDDRKKLDTYEIEFWNGIIKTSSEWSEINKQTHIEYPRNNPDSRKNFALLGSKSIDHNIRTAIFKAWDENPNTYNWKSIVIDTIRRNISTIAKTDAIRYIWGNAKWLNYEE